MAATAPQSTRRRSTAAGNVVALPDARQRKPNYDRQIRHIWRMCAAGKITINQALRWEAALIHIRDGDPQ